MSSRAAPAAATLRATDRLWAKAAELERDFAGYKRWLAERKAHAASEAVDGAGGSGTEEEEERRGDAAAAGRGRRYEEYVRRRDERLRQEWRARMERKEAEMKALWARLDRAGSRGRRDGDGELTAASHGKEGHVNLQQKPGNLEVKVKPIVSVTPRCSPATKLARARPRTSVQSSPAAASPRLSTPDPRRRPSHSHRDPLQAEPPATPRKENRFPPPSTSEAVAAPATPRPRTMLSRSKSMIRDRSCSSVRGSPRPPRFQLPRSSYDSASNLLEELVLPPNDDVIAETHRGPCFSEQAALADVKKASAVASELFHPRSSGNGAEPASAPLVTTRDEPDSDSNAIARADGSGDNRSNNEDIDRSSDKVGGVEITGDSDTEPSYVYIKKDSDEQTPRPAYQGASAGLGTCPGAELRSDNKDSDNVEDTMESTGSNDLAGETPVTDAEEASRTESFESLYSNVQSSFSQRSERDTSATDSPFRSPPTVPSPESDAARPRKNPEEDAEKSIPIPTTPRSSVTVSVTVQSPMDAMTGLKRFLTFGKKNVKGSEAAVVERVPHSVAPAARAGDDSISGGWPAAASDSVKPKLGYSDVAAPDDLDKSYVISPHVRSVQSCVPSYPANAELKEAVLHAKSPRVHRSFFSFSSFKSRAN